MKRCPSTTRTTHTKAAASTDYLPLDRHISAAHCVTELARHSQLSAAAPLRHSRLQTPHLSVCNAFTFIHAVSFSHILPSTVSSAASTPICHLLTSQLTSPQRLNAAVPSFRRVSPRALPESSDLSCSK